MGLFVFLLALLFRAAAQDAPAKLETGTEESASPPGSPDGDEKKSDRRRELNLLGTVDTDSGEGRRNENVQFNLIDNNLLKELLIRMGTTATIVPEFLPERNYY